VGHRSGNNVENLFGEIPKLCDRRGDPRGRPVCGCRFSVYAVVVRLCVVVGVSQNDANINANHFTFRATARVAPTNVSL